jgi:hypothetical protein
MAVSRRRGLGTARVPEKAKAAEPLRVSRVLPVLCQVGRMSAGK